MNKKMLLVGINDYQGLLPTLQAPQGEIERWEKLLKDQYGFTNSTAPLLGAAATKTAILDAFRALITGAKADDQLIFAFAGHGDVQRTMLTGRDWWDECLVTYPGDPAGIYISDVDINRIAKEERLPVGTDLTFIIDGCWGGIEEHPGRGPAAAIRRGVDYARVRTFGAFGVYGPPAVARNPFALRRFANDLDIERPVVVAGCRPHQPAAELFLDGEYRMLFSKRAIDFLHANTEATFSQLIAGIKPLHPDVPQEAELRINRSRDDEKFPGEPTDEAAALQFERQRIAALTATAAAAARSRGRGASPAAASRAARSAALLATTTGEIRIEGIACFADAQSASNPFVKRLLLPYDPSTDPVGRHVAFLEVPVDQVLDWNGALPPYTAPHVGSGLLYHRWELSGHRIEITNVDTTGALSTTTAYNTNVPAMKAVVPGSALNDYPHATCYDDAPDASIVSAYLNITAGTLSVGPLDLMEAQFTDQQTFTWRGRMPKWVTLQVPLLDDNLRIRIMPFGSNEPADATNITLDPGGTLRIGTLRDVDISGWSIPMEYPHEHFPLYYSLAYTDPVPSPLFLPYPIAAPLNACSPTNWP